MKKNLVKYLGKSQLKFAIKKERQKNGKFKLTPVVKGTGLFDSWTAIVRVNDTYHALDIYNNFRYTEDDCKNYIQGFKMQLLRENGHIIEFSEILEVE